MDIHYKIDPDVAHYIANPGPVANSPHVSVANGLQVAEYQGAWAQVVKMRGREPSDVVDEYKFWTTLCSLNESELCHNQLAVIFGVASGQGPTPDGLKNSSVMVGGGGIVRSLSNPESMRRATVKEVKTTSVPDYAYSGGAGGTYRLPGNSGVTITWEEGGPEYRNVFHNGNYLKYQFSKDYTGGKSKAVRVPLEGNPDMDKPIASTPGDLPGWFKGSSPTAEPSDGLPFEGDVAGPYESGEAMPDSRDEDASRLATNLMGSTGGVWELEGATRLIVEHGFWLRQTEFSSYVGAGDSESGSGGLYIDWVKLARDLDGGAISGDEEDLLVLKVAATLRGTLSLPIYEIENVEPRTMRAIMRSIATAAGYGEDVDQWCPLDIGG